MRNFLKLFALLIALSIFINKIHPQEKESKDSKEKSKSYLIAKEGKGYLEEIDGQMVLHLKGSHYEMGFQHGKLLSQQVKENVKAYLYDFALGDRKLSREYLEKIYEAQEKFIPDAIKDEMKGLSEGSGVPLEDIQLVHILPTLYHCSGAAVWGKATKDSNLYHYRSLDYATNIGKEKKVQENACLIIYEPDNEIAHVVVGWAGTLGCVTGMNEKGISIGEMGSRSNDESFEGEPMWFILRDVLRKSSTLDEAIKIMKEAKWDCGYNFIVSDGKIPEAVAFEVTHSIVEVFRGGDEKENIKPHWAIKDCVRRVNHFVGEKTAKTQRKEYDPTKEELASWLGYEKISKYIEEHYGKFDAELMIQLCKQYPPTHSCLHQAVFSPGDLNFYVANAKSPEKEVFCGAQNQTFYHYNLKELLEKNPDTLPLKPKDQKTSQTKINIPEEKGKFKSRPFVIPEAVPDDLKKIMEVYKTKEEEFEWKLKPRGKTEFFYSYELSFPSPIKTEFKENNTVYCDYYKPVTRGKHPAIVVLHHTGGSFEVEQMLCMKLAKDGIASIMLWMPYYGKRSSEKAKRLKERVFEDVEILKGVVQQTIADIHRAVDWLAQRDEVDSQRVNLAGVSLGALIGSVASSLNNNINKSVLIIGGGDLAKIIFNSSRETKSAAEKLKKLGFTEDSLREKLKDIDPLTFASLLNAEKVLMLNASEDEVIPKKCTEDLYNAIGKPKIIWYKGTHYSIALYTLDIFERISKFVRE